MNLWNYYMSNSNKNHFNNSMKNTNCITTSKTTGETWNIIPCIIAWSDQRRHILCDYAGHYLSTTSHDDSRTWYHKCQVRFLLKSQTNTGTCLDRHTWTNQNFLTRIGSPWASYKLSISSYIKPTIKILRVAINDNNNLALSIFDHSVNLLVIVFGPRYFSALL